MVHDFHSYVKEPEGIWDLLFDVKLIPILKILIDSRWIAGKIYKARFVVGKPSLNGGIF